MERPWIEHDGVEVMGGAIFTCKSTRDFMREGYAGRWENAARITGLTVESAKQQHMALRMVAGLICRPEEDPPKVVSQEPVKAVPSNIVMPNTLERACEQAGISVAEAKSERRTRTIAHRRWHVMYIMRQTGMSLPEIGRRLGGKNHTSVMNGIRQFEKRLLAGLVAE